MRHYRRYRKHRVIVQLANLTLAGTLEQDEAEALELSEATAISPDGSERRPIDGRVIVERSHVLWVQVL